MKVNNDVLKIIARASERLYEAVVPTLGPSGQFAILYNGNGEPVNLGEHTINVLKNAPEQKYNQKALNSF